MKIHPIAELFPRMSDEEFAALRDDIDAFGLREPIWTWNGQIIDGRHRFQACEELGIKRCATREFDGTEAELIPFVLSLNLKRRHMDESQRAMVAARISALKTGQHADQGVPIGTAAAMVNVGERSVKRARKVIDEGTPALAAAVEKGEVSVAAAAEVAELPKAEQRRLVKDGTVAEKASELRAEKKPKAEKPSEVEKLQAQNEELNSQLAELAKQQEPLQDEVTFLRKIEDEGDKLKEACAEVKRLQALVRVQEERIRGLMNEKNEAVRAAKMWKAKFEKAERAAA